MGRRIIVNGSPRPTGHGTMHSARRGPATAGLLWLLVVPLLAAAVLFITVGIPDSSSVALLVVSGMLCVVGVARGAVSGLRPISVVFYSFWFTYLVLGPTAQLTLGRVAWGDTRVLTDQKVVTSALLLATLALVAFFAGELASSTPEGVAARRVTRVKPVDPVRGRVLTAIVFALILDAPIAIAANGGIETYFTSRRERRSILTSNGYVLAEVGGAALGLVTILPVALSVSGALLAIYRFKAKRLRGERPGWRERVPIAICLIGIVIFANPISQPRFVATAAIGSVLIAVISPRSMRSGYAYVSATLVAAILAYPLANVFRSSSRGLGEITQTTYTGVDFDGFQQSINAMNFAASNGHSMGSYILSAILYFVPRSIWPGKMAPASIDVAVYAGYDYTNLSLPIHAELFLDLGWIGMIVAMFAMGILVHWLDSHWLAAPQSKPALFVPYVAMAVLGIIRGPLGSQGPIWLTVLALLFLGLRGSRRGPSAPHARKIS